MVFIADIYPEFSAIKNKEIHESEIWTYKLAHKSSR